MTGISVSQEKRLCLSVPLSLVLFNLYRTAIYPDGAAAGQEAVQGADESRGGSHYGAAGRIEEHQPLRLRVRSRRRGMLFARKV